MTLNFLFSSAQSDDDLTYQPHILDTVAEASKESSGEGERSHVPKIRISSVPCGYAVTLSNRPVMPKTC